MHHESTDPLILVAIADNDYRTLITQILEKNGFAVLTADSAGDALALFQSHQLNGLVTTSDIAIAEVNNEAAGLMKATKDKIPTVTLITPDTWKLPNLGWVFDTVYNSRVQEYIHTPIGVGELLMALKRVGVTRNENQRT